MRHVSFSMLLLVLTIAQPCNSWGLFGSSTKLEVGDDAPRFNAPLLEGGDFDLGPHIGQNAILLDFWSIYCVSCVQEMPKLVDIHNRYKDQGLVTIGVDLDSFGTKRVVKFVRGLDFEISYPIVVDKTRQVAARYGVSVLPTTVIIDRGGKVLYNHVGYAPGDEKEIEEKVKHALGSAQ